MEARWRGFIAGLLMSIAIRSLMQDAIGKEAYLKAAPHLWTSPWISIPVAVFLLLCGIVAMAPDPKKEDQ